MKLPWDEYDVTLFSIYTVYSMCIYIYVCMHIYIYVYVYIQYILYEIGKSPHVFFYNPPFLSMAHMGMGPEYQLDDAGFSAT